MATTTITITAEDDPPALGNNALTITEGQTVVLSASELSATDAESVDGTLQFTVSGVTGGQFEEVANPGVAITAFTQAQVTAGDIQFVHDGGESAPGYSVTVSDGALTDGPQAATITFTNQNDAPSLGNNALTITEGQTVVLTGANVSATDVDDVDGALQFTVSGVTGGQFEEVANPGVAITTFTPGQVTAGDIQFVHDGGEAAPAYSLSVSDGALSDGPQAATVTFTNQNDAPTANADAATTFAGGSTTIDLAANDSDPDDGLDLSSIQIVTGAANGTVVVNGDGTVTYTHDDSATVSDSFTYTIRDASGLASNSASVNLTITAVDASPTISAPSSDSTLEDTALTFSSGTGNAIVISDDPGELIQVSLSVVNGSLTLASTGGLTFVSGTNGTASFEVEGAVEAVNSGLEGMTYVPSSDYAGPDTLSMTVDDATLLTLDLDPSLLAKYTFNAQGNLGKDTSPSGTNDGTLTGDAFGDNSDPVRDEVLVLDGAGDSLAVAGLLGEPTSVTLAGWVDLDAGSSDGSHLVSLGDSVVLAVDRGQDSVGVQGFFYDGSSFEATASGTFIAGTGWHHVAYTFDDAGDAQTLYIDGVVAAQTSFSAGISYTNGTGTVIGSHGDGESGFDLDGRIDDIRVYDRALTSGEIGVLFQAPPQPFAAAAVSLTVVAQNDPPALGNNALTITEGQAVVLSGTDLSATDVDTVDSTLEFTVSGVSGGQFEEVANPSVAITTFTQAQVTAGDVQFVHDGGEAAPTYSVTVSDGALSDGPEAATITFTNQNDAPALGNNALTIMEGQTVVLTGANVSATDVDNVDSTLQFTVSGVTGGQFEEVANAGVAITSFTQAQVTGGDIQFVHDGGEAAPAYSVTVSDGALSDGPEAATITFTNQNDAPALGNNALTISEGQTIVLSGANVSATDVDNADSTLQFAVSGVTGGQFEEVANPGVAITTFTQAQVTAGDVQFVHDGGEAAPAYSVTVSDGALSDGPQAAAITFTNQNDAPTAVADADTTLEGQTVTIDLASNDTDPDDGLDVTSIQIVAGPANGSVVVNGDGTVDYTHDGSETTSDSFTYSIRDLAGAISNIATVSVTVTPQNDAPTLGNNALTITEGQTVVLTGANVSATDVDNVDSTLQFTVSGVTGGQFEGVANPGVAITTFTQAQVTAGDIQFVHDGGEAAPAYSVTVSDGALSDGPEAATITFTNQNDAPVLVNNALTITEGQTVVLSGANVSATDVDSVDSTLQFTVSGVSGGQFEEVANAGVAITSFTQAQVTAGDIQFVHDGGEAAPAYSVTVSDGALSDGPEAATITFTNQNDAPTAVADADTALEGQTITIDLAANDTDPDDGLDLTSIQIVTGPTNGSVVVNGDGTVDYTHDGSETTSDSFTYTIRDLSGVVSNTGAVNITVTATNDPPVLGSNALTITEGQTVVLTGVELSATDYGNGGRAAAVHGFGRDRGPVRRGGEPRRSDHGLYAGAGDGGRHPVRARRRGGRAGVFGDGVGRCRERWPADGDDHVHESERRAGPGEQRADDHRGANGRAHRDGSLGDGRGQRGQRASVYGLRRLGRPVRRGGERRRRDHVVHAGAGDGRRHPVRPQRGRSGAGVLGDGVGRSAVGWPRGGDDHVHEPERRAGTGEQRAHDYRGPDRGPVGHGLVGDGRGHRGLDVAVHCLRRHRRPVRGSRQSGRSDHDVHAGASHGGRHPVRARRRGGRAGVLGDGVRWRAVRRPSGGDDHVHESERRADAGEQRADDHRGANGRTLGSGAVGDGRRQRGQYASVHDFRRLGWPVRRGGERRRSDHVVHASAGDGRRHPVRSQRGRSGAGVLGDGVGRSAVGWSRGGDDHVHEPERRAGAREQRAHDYRGPDRGPVGHGLVGDGRGHRGLDVAVHCLRRHRRPVRGSRQPGRSDHDVHASAGDGGRHPVRARRRRSRAGVLGDGVRWRAVRRPAGVDDHVHESERRTGRWGTTR